MITAASQPTERNGDQLSCRTDCTIAPTVISKAAHPATVYSHRVPGFIVHPVL
jgi:hypothetical protein